MNRRIYPNRMTFGVYDDNHVIAYLNEEVLEKYVPEDAPEGTEPSTHYAYTGTESDGGTLLEVSAKNCTRDELINAVIRSEFSQTAEDAIKTHHLMLLDNPEIEKKEEYQSEWVHFLIQRNAAIIKVDSWKIH